ncbi:hypothetical protein [Desulfitobacterium dehalogenans]
MPKIVGIIIGVVIPIGGRDEIVGRVIAVAGAMAERTRHLGQPV